MRYLLTGVAMIAALAFSAPVGAQPTSPSGGNAVGTPGPNPGGPGLTPYTTGAPPSAATPSGQMPAGGRRTSGERIPPILPDTSSPPSSASDTTSATPPSHRHARHMAQSKPSHHPSRFPNVQGNVANELNQAELARLQSGNFTPPAAPPPPEMSQGAPGGATQANPGQLNRMPPGGRPTSGGPR